MEPLRIAQPQHQRRFSKTPLMILLQPPRVMARSPDVYSSVLISINLSAAVLF
jgi:hypothetical protein